MKKTILISVFLIILGHVIAQKPGDEELNCLISTIATLRQSDEVSWNNTLKVFGKDKAWTMMDEIARDDNEYWLIGNRQFKLNPILNQCGGHADKMLPGDFLNGNDPNFNYSLIERGIKKSRSVSYELRYREGRQVFVVMPYDSTRSKEMVFELFLNGKSMGTSQLHDDGNLYLAIDKAVKSNDTLRIEITNNSNVDMPVVIINHNTRKH